MNDVVGDVDNDVELVRSALLAPQAPALDLPVPRFTRALDQLHEEVLARFRHVGLDAGTAEATLADVPRKVAAYGDGIDVPWLLGLARADVVALGRLQFERVAGTDGHAVHLPEAGPLSDEAVEDSLARAVEVLGARAFHCTSWLLDPLLPPALGPDSGIVRFAARFALGPVERGEEGDRAVAKFVFRRPLREVLDLVEPRTRLERLVVGHLRAGGHWSEPRGLLSARG
ncbi:hypothetical protein ACFQ46_04295 [Kineococcus sp. GCM10028916]|uniref:hypothetical protein n=1 Tax=Kineococcus sp. GCM10028916 TaxID=3273394 RepID=UPI003640B247